MEIVDKQALLIRKLRRVEDRFNFLIQHVCDNFLEVNVRTGECWMMQSTHHMVSKNNFKEQIDWFADHLIVPEERESYRRTFELENLLTCLHENEGFYQTIYSAIYPDGIRFLLIVNALISDSQQPEEEYVLSYAQDITELKRHEEQNRQLIDISQQLLNVSQHDALTGLYNRAAAEKAISDHLCKEGESTGGTLLLLDIDYFKQINDCHGHDVGDKVLKYLARSMQDVFRSNDILCRWGGDEFLVFMRDLDDVVVVESRMERLRCKMADYVIGKGALPLTLSAGIIVAAEGGALDELFKQSDEVLYKVKKNGRNGFFIELLE